MTAFTFNSRESYKAFRAQWKADYKQLTSDQRAAKLAYKDAMRAYHLTEYKTVERSKAWNALYDAHSKTESLRREANQMIEELHEAKAEAQRQYLAAKEAANV